MGDYAGMASPHDGENSAEAGSTVAHNIKRETSPTLSEDVEGDLPLCAQPPPSSFFAASQEFKPDQTAPFEHEFSRYMSSQGIAPRTAEYNRQRTRAIVDEIKFYYCSQEPTYDPSLSKAEREQAQRLHIYRGMCRAVRLPVGTTESACISALQTVLVNIVDYIDNARTGQPVKVWSDFAAFRDYTLQDGKRINRREAKADGGFLAVLLRRLTDGNGRAGRRAKKRRQRARSGVAK